MEIHTVKQIREMLRSHKAKLCSYLDNQSLGETVITQYKIENFPDELDFLR